MSERVTPACSLCGEAVGPASLVSVRHRTRRLTWGWAVSFLLFSLIGSVQPLAVGVSCAYQPQKACTSEIKELTSRLGRSHKATC